MKLLLPTIVITLVGFVGARPEPLFDPSLADRAEEPSVTNPPSKVDDGGDNLLPEATFSSSGPWTTVQCDQKGITNNQNSPKDRWEVAHASDAWDQLMDGYKGYLETGKGGDADRSFDTYAWNMFHYQDYPQCYMYASDSCMDFEECGHEARPGAGFLIVNSIVAIHRMMDYSYEHLNTAKDSVDSQLETFVKSFAQMPDTLPMEIMKMILDTLTFGVSVGSSFSWNILIKQAKLFKNDDNRSAWKDVFNAGVGYASVMPKDSMKAPTDEAETISALKEIAGGFFMDTRNSQANFLRDIINAREEPFQKSLTDMVQNGAMHQYLKNVPDYQELETSAKALFWGYLMPWAWQISPESQRPFILRVDREDYKCGDEVENLAGYEMGKPGFNLGKYMSPDTAKKSQWCDKQGNTWFLLNAKYPEECHSPNPERCLSAKEYFPFTSLKGGDSETLDGTAWGGITLEDIVTSSYGGFVANGDKNGYEMPLDSNLGLNDDFSGTVEGELPLWTGIKTPGFFNFTICLNAGEASGRIMDREEEICPESPSKNGVNPPINDAGFTPGNCRIHLTQWENNDGDNNNLNPLDDWQTQITIFDGSGGRMVQATKQPIDGAIAIESKLPFDLIVGDGKDSEDDTIQFWYSDQWWSTDSDSSEYESHQCSVGKYDGGKREGDCSFTCASPTEDPPSSVAVPVPESVATAFLGTGDSPTQGSPSESEFSPGWCVVHVRQYQKTQKDNQQNPGGDFSLELTLADGGDSPKLIDYTEKTIAPEGKSVHVQGPLPYALVVKTRALDNDPLDFAYAGTKWDSDNTEKHHCSFEDKYDAGIRDGDCGFTC